MLLKLFFVFVLSLVVICEANFVDTLSKCPKDDGVCLGKLVEYVLKNLPDNGIEGIPPIDPAKVNFTISIPNLVEITVDGVAKGIRKTVVNNFRPNFEDKVIIFDLLCNIVIKGNYTVSSSSQALRSLFDNKDIHGNGYGKIKLENLKINVVLPFDLKKVGDEIFLIARDKVKYTFDIGKLMIAVHNLYLGDIESSATINSLINQEWKTIVGTYGKFFADKALDLIKDFTDVFFIKVSTKHYINEDLSPYLTETE